MTGRDPDAVAVAVDRAFPDATIRERRPVESGNRKRTVVVRLGVGNGVRTVVVQVGADADELRTEAALGCAIAARTDVPVPAVLAGGTVDGDDAGYLVTEHVRGDDLHERFVALDGDERERVARFFGGTLARLHRAFEFDGVGRVGLRYRADGDDERWTRMLDGADPGSMLGVAWDGRTDAGGGRWPGWLRRHADAGIRALPEAFDDVRPRLRRVVEEAAASLPAAPDARLYPWDLRPGNALVADGRVSAVLDWGEPLAADPGLAVAKAEHLVCDWYVADGSALRHAFREGYRSRRPLPPVPAVYRLVATVRSAVDGDGVVTRPRYPELTGADAVAFHRERLLAALDG